MMLLQRIFNPQKEFSVNLAAMNQNVVCSMVGRYSGKKIDKISLLKEAGLAS
jgi:hypothetical protein